MWQKPQADVAEIVRRALADEEDINLIDALDTELDQIRGDGIAVMGPPTAIVGEAERVVLGYLARSLHSPGTVRQLFAELGLFSFDNELFEACHLALRGVFRGTGMPTANEFKAALRRNGGPHRNGVRILAECWGWADGSHGD